MNFMVRALASSAANAVKIRFFVGIDDSLAVAVERGSLSLSELERRYCTVVYSQAETYEAAAERLAIDRRTLKAKIDRDLLAKLKKK